MLHIALVCAVELEAEPLLRKLSGLEPMVVGRKRGYRGMLGGTKVTIVVCGMGKTNASHGLTSLLESVAVHGVLGFGVAGAFPGLGLDIGDVAVASSQHYGDEGVETPTGWMTCEGIGIPLWERGEARYFNDFPVDSERLRRVTDALGDVCVGAFVTVSCCSGTTDRGERLRRRFGAVCETMEGAAYAHTAAIYDLGYMEVRGISNLVEDRDLSKWRLQQAAAAAAGAVPTIVANWSPQSVSAPEPER